MKLSRLLAGCSFAAYCLLSSVSQGQVPAGSVPARPARRLYVGAEAVIFANQDTRFTQAAAFLAAEGKDLVPRPALVVGYLLTPALIAELRAQDLPVLTGYSYQQDKGTTYIGFGQHYTQDYLYVPVHLVWRLLGRQSKFGLSVLGGGGPAWTDTKEGLVTPNGTQQFSSTDGGTILYIATTTQRVTQQQGFFMGFEAGLRGTWQPHPRLGVDISIRQLWSTTQSARDIELTIQVDNQRINTTMQTPVRGICSGLGIHYLL